MIKIKKITLSLLLLIFIIGCASQKEESPKIALGQETEIIKNTTPTGIDIIGEPEVSEPQTTKIVEVYNTLYYF